MLANPPLAEIFNYSYFEQTCHYQGLKKTFPIQFLIDKWNLCTFMKIFAQNFFVGNRISNKAVTTRRRKPSFKMRWNLCIFMKNFARKLIVRNWNLNKYVTTRGQKKPFEFNFWWIRQNLCIFKKNFAPEFLIGNWILNKCFTTSGRERNLSNSFLVNKSKSMHFQEKFCSGIFHRKLNFEQMCYD